MGRRPTKIKVDVIWETTDDPNAILPWVRVTKLLMQAKVRCDEYMARLENEDPALFLVENLLSFAREQEDVDIQSNSGVTYRVEVPLDMVRKNKGFLYTRQATGRTHTEPLAALTKVAERYLLIHSLSPADYCEDTKNATFTLALLGQFLAVSGPKEVQSEELHG